MNLHNVVACGCFDTTLQETGSFDPGEITLTFLRREITHVNSFGFEIFFCAIIMKTKIHD